MATKRKKKAGSEVEVVTVVETVAPTPSTVDAAKEIFAEANKILSGLNGVVAGVNDRRAAYLAFSFAYAKLVTDFDMDVDACMRELSEMIASEKSVKTEHAVSTH